MVCVNRGFLIRGDRVCVCACVCVCVCACVCVCVLGLVCDL